jgi:cystathionine beta-lyase
MNLIDETQYDFNRIIDRRSSLSLKWNRYDQDVLPMWIADMDFVSPQPVLDALQNQIDHGIFGYPSEINKSSPELSELIQAIINRMDSRYQWQVQPEEIVLIPGVVPGFNLACHALVAPQEEVLIQTPVYSPILNAADHTHIQKREMELTYMPDGSYAFNEHDFEGAITSQTRLFILCNPHNPVGKVFSRSELELMADTCLRHGITICSDEIHSDLVFPGNQHIPIASLDPEVAQRTITLIAPSKTFNIAGLQCSVAIIQNQELKKKFLDSRQGLLPWVNLMGLVAARAAYMFGDTWLKQLMQYLEANRDFLVNYVNRELPGVRVWSPQGTYLAWLDCRAAGLQTNPYKFFLEQARVACNDGATFGQAGNGFVRLNFGCPKSTLEEALSRMRNALSAVN